MTDNVQTVKKKMQTILNVSSEQSSLVLGGTVLKSDLSEIRNDSPVLLTRELQRSQSTPCFINQSDTQELMDYNNNRPFEVVGGLRCCPTMKRILKDVVKALECGVEPIAVSGGLGGAYYFRNCRGDSVAVIKPTDEEPFAPNNPKGFTGKTLGQPGLKRAVRVGETGVREVAAYLLDHEHFAGVPSTVLVKVSHRILHVNADTSVHNRDYGGKPCLSPVSKLASCQAFVSHDYDASDHGTSSFSVSSVHKIGILDVRIFNTDRHAGNILVRKKVSNEPHSGWGRSSLHVKEIVELVPIDHGLCLPEGLEDPYFEWLHWPQSSVPFSEEELEYIAKLDEVKDVEMLRAELPMLREACLRMLIIATSVLKKGAAAGLCLAEIGEMMSKDVIEEVSQFELIFLQANRALMQTRNGVGNDDDDDDDDGEALAEILFGDEGDELAEQFEMDGDVERNEGEKDGSVDRVPILTLPNARGLRAGPREGHHETLAPLDEDGLLLAGKAAVSAVRSINSLNKRLSLGSPRNMWNATSGHQTISSPRMKQPTQSSSSRPMCYRSISLNHHIPMYGNYCARKKGLLFKDVPLTPAPKMGGGKGCSADGNGRRNLFSLGDMSDDEWACFLSCFNGVLDEALAYRSNQSVNFSRHRLGTSCRF
jgi:hypothetical protein